MSDDAHGATARAGRIDSFGIVVLAYLVALVAALWTVAWCDPARPFWSLAMADLVATLVIFAFSSLKLDNSQHLRRLLERGAAAGRAVVRARARRQARRRARQALVIALVARCGRSG